MAGKLPTQFNTNPSVPQVVEGFISAVRFWVRIPVRGVFLTSFPYFLAPIFYIKRIPDAEIRIIGTVASLRQERSPESTNAPPVSGFVISSETAIKSERTDSERNVEESKRDVSLEELLSDGSKEGNKNKKSVERDNHFKTRIKSHKKSVSSTATGK